jgi:hypothetical protein
MRYDIKNTTLWFRHILAIGVGIGILCFLITKSALMQITCDEAYTVIILAKETVWNLVSYKSSYTNNHILNTLCVKFLFWLTGSDSHILARVPNIAAFVLYFYAVYRFSLRYIADNWLSLMFVCVLCCNPYLLDFFALIRGYGLSIGLMMGSIYCTARYIMDNDFKSLPLSLGLAILAVYAQFATLHYFLGLSLLLIIKHLHDFFTEKKNTGIVVQIASFIVLTALLYAPLTAIIRDNQIAYYGNDGFWTNTLMSVLKNSVYAQGYFDPSTIEVFTYLLAALFIIVALYIGKHIWLKTGDVREKQYPSVFAASLFVCVALSPILQFYLLNNQYVIDRTALFYYPLMAMLMPIVPLFFEKIKRGVYLFLCGLFIVFSVNHIIRSNHLDSYREWWYDVHTYEILDFLKTEYDKTDKKQPLHLDTHWTFNPSFQYHRDNSKLEWLAPPPYNSQPDTFNYYDFYYTVREEVPILEKKYTIVKEYGNGQWYLMKHK